MITNASKQDSIQTILNETYKNVNSTFLKGLYIGKNTEVIMSNDNQDKLVELINREVGIPEITDQINEFIDAALNVPNTLLDKTEKVINNNSNTKTTGFRSNTKSISNQVGSGNYNSDHGKYHKKKNTKTKRKQKQKQKIGTKSKSKKP